MKAILVTILAVLVEIGLAVLAFLMLTLMILFECAVVGGTDLFSIYSFSIYRSRSFVNLMRSIIAVLLLCAVSYAETPDYVVKVENDLYSINWRKGVGTLIAPEYVLTASHVAGWADDTKVTFNNGDEVSATVVHRSIRFDLAILKLDEARHEDTIPIIDISKVNRNQTVTIQASESYVGEAGDFLILSRAKIRNQFIIRVIVYENTDGAPLLIDNQLVGIVLRYIPGVGVRCVNTPQIRTFLAKIDDQ